ncbi:MAG: putative DNA binding domain-containing protein [Candidatus Cloacimonetes bacterium]|nr:putative DNA binding domain-containing protein [Candidatus Cloacimonadota bacterium]
MIQKAYCTNLTIPNSLEFLPLCAAFIEHNSQLIGFDPDEVQAISLAVEETLSNLILYAYTPGMIDTIDITCWQTPLGIEIIIKDKGMPFDYNEEEDYDPEQPELDNTRGLGMFLIKKTVDEVIFTNCGSEGKETHLVKYITKCPLSDLMQKPDQHFKQEPLRRKNVNFLIRRLADNEAFEISRAVYRVYGYNYFNEHAYFPDRIEKLNKNGNLDTLAAVTEDNIFAGTCAVYRESLEGKLGELQQAVVLDEFRGNHCMEQLLNSLLAIAQDKNMLGVFARSETSEIFAQRALHRLETRDCALLLGFTSRLVWDKGNKAQQRESMVLSYLPLGKDLPKKIYVPEHHQNIVSQIYENIGYQREFNPTPYGKKPWHEEAELEIKYFYNTSAAEIKVALPGKDIITKLKTAKKEVKLKKFAVIYLYLSLENPFTPLYFEQIENLDFFFAGIIPHEKFGDSIILQYMNNIDIDIENLVLYSDFSRQLAAYVSQCRSRHPLRLLIDAGESEKLEFKSTMRLNLKDNQKDSRIGFAILKSISAFLNTDGGTLLVGVEDNGNILGSEIEDFASDDKYLLHFSQLLQHNIGLDNSRFVHYKLVDIDNKKILKVDCEASPKPIFLIKDSVEDFYIRSGPASKKLSISTAITYISEHFPKHD